MNTLSAMVRLLEAQANQIPWEKSSPQWLKLSTFFENRMAGDAVCEISRVKKLF